MSAYLQEKVAYVGQKEVYEEASDSLAKLAGLSVSGKQIERVCHHYGGLYEAQSTEPVEASCTEADQCYAMVDGSLLLTKDKDLETGKLLWREMKLGRVFKVRHHMALSAKRNWIYASRYTAHFGDVDTFFEKLSREVDPLRRVIFLGDGARWIWDRVSAFWPEAVQILDYYHCKEHLFDFARVSLQAAVFADKVAMLEWVSEQEGLLFSDAVEVVMGHIAEIDADSEAVAEAQSKLLHYFGSNQARMRYGTYRRLGYLIGSGPIESAHRHVIHKRMKLSGQRWTIQGAQAVANLRVAYASNQWSRVRQLIRKAA
jgi:hypothetical protein